MEIAVVTIPAATWQSIQLHTSSLVEASLGKGPGGFICA